jgi:hypothetical protein
MRSSIVMNGKTMKGKTRLLLKFHKFPKGCMDVYFGQTLFSLTESTMECTDDGTCHEARDTRWLAKANVGPDLRASPAVALYLRAVKRRTSAPYPHAARGACEHFAGSSKTALDNAARMQHFSRRCIVPRARPAQTTIPHMHTFY